MARNWYYSRGGQSLGPVPEEQLRGMIQGGTVHGEDLVWSEGMAAWTPARQVPAFAPPPAPPPAAPVYQPPAPAPAPRPAPAPYVPPPAPYVPPQAPQAAPLPVIASAPASEGVSQDVLDALRSTKPWVRFLSVLGFIGLGLVVLGALVVLGISLFGSSIFPGMPSGLGFLVGGLYLVIALIQLPPVLFLSRYASRIGDLLRSESVEDLEPALRAQKSFWKYVGIFTMVMIILYVIGLIAAIVLPAAVGGLMRR